MRILVVDDDALAAEMIVHVLASHYHECVVAQDAMEAIIQLQVHPDIALIVSDMHMPLISGLDLYAMLREQEVALPFILLTGDTPNSALAATAGLYACLQKEADLALTLGRTVEQALSCAHARF